MAREKIALSACNGLIKATAFDKAGNPNSNGDLPTGPSRNIDWFHETAPENAKEFVVRFLKAGIYGWPFQKPPEPTDKKLRVSYGIRLKTKLQNVTNLDWKYEVDMTGYTKLDPMIIIRGRVVTISTVAVVLAVIGALAVAGLLGWWLLPN